MTRPRAFVCPHCGSADGYEADITMIGKGRFDWHNDAKEMNLNLFAVKKSENIRCVTCKREVVKRRGYDLQRGKWSR